MIIASRTLVGAFSVITNLRMELFEALVETVVVMRAGVYWQSILGKHAPLCFKYSSPNMTERFHPLLQGEVIHLQLTTQVWIIRRKRDQENMLEYALELGKGFDT